MRPRCSVFRLLVRLVPLVVSGVASSEPFESILVAERDCSATVSTKRPDNPGGVRVESGVAYRVVARNKPDPTHYLLRIEGVDPKDRWVQASCGRLASAPEAGQNPKGVDKSLDGAGVGQRSMAVQTVLAASWQPAFCERRRSTPECRTQVPDRPDARQFSLHGLWPQPIDNDYCGVGPRERAHAESKDWGRLPVLPLDAPTRLGLAQRMPGVLSYLDRYEWIKHGTCYGTDAATYFDRAMALLDQLNASVVRVLFESNTGKRLRAAQIRAAFDRSFGAGAGERVGIECDGGSIVELRIGLKGPIAGYASLPDQIRAAPSRTLGCRGGWVDRAGPGR